MVFTWPLAFLGLLPVLLISAVYILQQRRQRKFALRYSGIGLVQAAAAHGRSSWVRRHAPAAFYLLGMTSLVVALSRPEVSFAKPESTGLVILAIDASGSMTANDIQPSRIDAARIAVREFVKKQPKGVRIGVVTFAGFATLTVAPTTNKEQVIASVDYLTLGRGTNIGDGLLVSLNAILQDERGEILSFAPDPEKLTGGRALRPDVEMIVLLSDGAATTGPPPLAVADKVGQAGIRVYVVGLGANSGAPPPPSQAGPNIGFGGRFMELDEPTLKGIAEKTDGKYFTAQNSGELSKIYKSLASHTTIEPQRDEITYFAGGIAAVLMIAGGVMAAMWSVRLP